MYSNGPPHMAEQKLNDQLENIYSSSVRIRGVALKTYQRRWTIGRSGERGSGIFVLAAQHDDDDIFVSVCVCVWTLCKYLTYFLKISLKRKFINDIFSSNNLVDYTINLSLSHLFALPLSFFFYLLPSMYYFIFLSLDSLYLPFIPSIFSFLIFILSFCSHNTRPFPTLLEYICIYIYIYIYISSSTDRLFRCITTLQCG